MSNRKKIKPKKSSQVHAAPAQTKVVEPVDVNALLSAATAPPPYGYEDALFDSSPQRPTVPNSAPSKPSRADSARDLMRNLKADTSIALTVAEVCDLLKISRSTLHRANLPGKVMVGGCVRYDKMQILAWWMNQQKKPSP